MSKLNFSIPFKPFTPPTRCANLTGRTFGKRRVFSIYAKHNGHTYWLCRCICGQWQHIKQYYLSYGRARSCGCIQRQYIQTRFLTHGETRKGQTSSEYRAYEQAKNRCNNPVNNRYYCYGARGIKFLFANFEEFINHIGRKPTSQHSLDRIDNNGHYKWGNVRWATRSEQSRNRRDRIPLTANGQTMLLCEWSAKIHIPVHILSRRKKRGWCNECIISQPLLNTRAKYVCPH